MFHTRSSIIFLDSAVTAVRSASRRDRGGSSGTLQLGQLAFSGYGPVFFVCAFDAVFKLVPVVEKLLDHFVGAAGLRCLCDSLGAYTTLDASRVSPALSPTECRVTALHREMAPNRPWNAVRVGFNGE